MHQEIPTPNNVNTLLVTATLPAVATLPATAALPAVATLPATATLPAVATLPDTASDRDASGDGNAARCRAVIRTRPAGFLPFHAIDRAIASKHDATRSRRPSQYGSTLRSQANPASVQERAGTLAVECPVSLCSTTFRLRRATRSSAVWALPARAGGARRRTAPGVRCVGLPAHAGRSPRYRRDQRAAAASNAPRT
jgi:hypothetical protein